MSASGIEYAGSTRISSPLASCGAMSHRLRSMMPRPSRHQSRTSSPELLDSGPRTCTRTVDLSRSFCSCQVSKPYPPDRLFFAAVFANHQTGMVLEQVRMCDSVMATDVRRRCQQHTLIAPQAPCNPRHGSPAFCRPQPDRTIETVDCQVRQVFGELKLYLGTSITSLKTRQRGPQPQASKTEA